MKNIIILFGILLIDFSCGISNGQGGFNPKKSTDNFFEIKYEDLLNNKKPIGLSQVATNVEYIKLETNKDCLLGQMTNFYFSDSLIFVAEENCVLKFSNKGKFLGKLASSGRGPKEITDAIIQICLIPDKKIFIAQDFAKHKLLYFSFNGELVKTVNYSPYLSKIEVTRDGRFVTYDAGSSGSNKYTFRLTNEHNDTISIVKNYYSWESNSNNGLVIAIHTSRPIQPFYYSKSKTFLKSLYDDTVYYVSSNKIQPGYFINLGKYKLPNNYIPTEKLRGTDLQFYREKAEKYNFVNVFEASDKIFLTSYSYNSKIAPKYIIYNKANKNGFYLYGGNDESTGIINDWDGGMNFWPSSSINDDKVYMPITISDIQKELNDKSNNKSVKYLEKKRQLENLVSTSDITDNPILMIVTLKH
jgi:hypothetical protein